MRKYLEVFKEGFDDTVDDKIRRNNWPYVAYDMLGGEVVYTVVLPANNEIWYTSSDGNVVNLIYPDEFEVNFVNNTYNNGIGVITFDGPVTSIVYRSFYYCDTLTSITIPNSVTSIGNSAFEGCSYLTSVTIPNSVTTIGEYAFQYCDSLTSITIPNSVTTIGRRAFMYCSALKSVTIPDSVTSIGHGAFNYCTGLTSVTIPNSVTSMGSGVFKNSSFTDPIYNAHCFAYLPTSYSGAYTIPEGITQIAGAAFSECRSLTSITIPNSVTIIGTVAFGNCTSLTSITIPDSVTIIDDGAFTGCISLPSITIPSSVTEIRGEAFMYCYSLTSITCKATTPPTLGPTNDLSNVTSIYVPADSVEAYKSANRWNAYADKILPIQE